MHPELLVNNIGFGISIITCLSLAILLYVKRNKNSEDSRVSTVFVINNIVFVIWQLSYVIGVNLSDPFMSRFAFMFNIAALFASILSLHVVLLLSRRYDGHKKVILFLYIAASALTLYYALFPSSFMLPSEPRLYFINYFVHGPLYPLQDSLYFFVVIYSIIQVVIAYVQGDFRLRNKLKYFVVALLYSYITGSMAEFLLYGFNVDPLITAFSGLYMIPMTYAIMKYDLMDINILAKRAFTYGLGITIVTLLILAISYANDYMNNFIPSFPVWVVPLISGTFAMAIGVFVWKKMKELDVLKYEFVDIVTHKFRTPLTHIKWSVENIRNNGDMATIDSSVKAIAEANSKLYELTDILAGISGSDESEYLYTISEEDIGEILDTTLKSAKERFSEKLIKIETHVADGLPKVNVDKKKTQFAIQMIMENALMYSDDNGKIIVDVSLKNNFIFLSIKDFGIGISKEDQKRLFTKFFRSKDATHAHTEGLGIGLYLSRDIMRRQGGDIFVESKGLGFGSTFTVKIPIKR